MDKVKSIHDWKAGGLHAAQDPGGNKPGQCDLLLKLSGTTFERVVPKKPGTYDCNPAYPAHISGPVVDRAKLDSNRISQL